jgi:alpha-galactosidase
MTGNDLTKMSSETSKILTDKDIIAIDQDPLGIEGFMFSAKDSVETWFKPLKEGDWAVCFLNRGLKSSKVEFNWTGQKVYDDLSKRDLNAGQVEFNLVNLWTRANAGSTKTVLKSEVPGHDVLVFRLKKK